MALLQIVLLGTPLVFWYIWTRITYYRTKQYANFPQAKPDPFWGHLKLINEAGKRPHILPGAHSDYAFEEIWKDANKPDVLLMDVRPFMYTIVVIADHDIAEQISKPSPLFKYSVTKSITTGDLYPIIGKKSVLTSEGEHWKLQRKRYNAGFAPSHLITQLPQIVNKTRRFLARLDEHVADGKPFELDELCVNLTFDIIGAVVMDLDFDAQSGREVSPVARAMMAVLEAFTGDSPFDRIDPFLNYKRHKLGVAMDREMKNAVRNKFNQLREAASNDAGGKQKPRSVVAIALEGNDTLDEELLQDAADQIKTFLFAGHDTTAILLQWVFYELTRQPRVLETLTEELDAVLGPSTDPEDIAEILISQGDAVLSKLTYLSAVIKEGLRLYPPAGSARMARKGTGATLTMKDGTSLNIEGMVLYSCHYLIQRDERVYGANAADFVPERWLGDTETSMEGTDIHHGNGSANGNGHTSKDTTTTSSKYPASSWRPFERGPRNCIGQELANLEARVIFAMAVRKYQFTKVGLGELVLEGGKPVLNEKGEYRVKSDLVNKRQITAKPLDGTLMTVRIR